MYYFLKESNFNLENNDFQIEINPKLTKKELLFFKKLLDNYNSESEYSVINIKSLNLPSDSIEHLVETFIKKTFKCLFFDKTVKKSQFYFGILGVASFEQNELIYDFSTPLKKSMETGNIFSRVGIINYLKFKLPSTKKIYNLVLKENKNKGVILFTVDELKKLLDMPTSKYPRFYDFETKSLNHIARDLEISEIFIWFEKVKDSSSRGGKIIEVKLHYSNSYHIKIQNKVNKLIREYANYINDFSKANIDLYQLVKKSNFLEVEEYLRFNYKSFFNN